jgi:choice-of-anchor C domain-containing protein
MPLPAFSVDNTLISKGVNLSTMKNLFVIAMIATIVSLFPVSLSAQIVNGSFEDTEVPSNAFFYYPGGSTIPGWTIGGSGYGVGIEVTNTDYWQASNGTNSLDLVGIYASSISQDIPTFTGVTYTVSFDMSGNPGGGNPVKTIIVTADGGQEATYTFDTSVEHNTTTDMGYSSKAYTFVANGPITTLKFAAGPDYIYGPVIDNVAMASVTAQVCHRNNGSATYKTMIVGKPAVAAHLAHGDTAGACVAQ